MPEPVFMLEERDATSGLLDKLKECADRNLVKVNSDKCNVLHLGRMRSCSGASWDLTRGSSFAEKSLSILADGAERKPAVCPGSKEGQQHPGLCEEVQSWEKKLIISSALTGLHLEYHVQFWIPEKKR